MLFSPEHLSLIKSGPALRRNFIDAALCQVKPAYAPLLSRYHHTLVQRNALLKDIPRHAELLDTLEIWDDRLARYGDAVARERAAYIQKSRRPRGSSTRGFRKIRNNLEYSIKKAPKI